MAGGVAANRRARNWPAEREFPETLPPNVL